MTRMMIFVSLAALALNRALPRRTQQARDGTERTDG